MSSSGEVGIPIMAAGTTFKSSRELQTRKSTGRSVVYATNEIIQETNNPDNEIQSKQDESTSDNVVINNDSLNDNVIIRTSGMVSELSESRYWADSFGMTGYRMSSQGVTRSSKLSRMFAHHRSVDLQAASASIIHQIHFNTSAAIPVPTSSSTSSTRFTSSNNTTLAVVGGPRVQLYGTAFDSALHRTLSMHSAKDDTTIPTTVSADKQVPTGGQLALSASFRQDGRLVAIGTDQGIIRIADCTSRATLCQFNCLYQMPIRAVEWFRNGQHLLSVGDDATLRIWQLRQTHNKTSGGDNYFDTNTTSSAAVLECKGHGDSIRCAVVWQMPESIAVKANIKSKYPYKALAATGSYDHTIRLWNMEDLEDSANNKNQNERCVSVLEHGAPVEALLFVTVPSTLTNVGSTTGDNKNTSLVPPVWLISAGGTIVKVWNPMNGTCVATIQTQHRKTITCLLAMPRIFRASSQKNNGNNVEYRMRLLTGGLDGLIRIHSFDRESGRIQHLHGIRVFPKGGDRNKKDDNNTQSVVGITALACTPGSDRIAIGTTAGTVLVRQKGPSVTNKKRAQEPKAGTYAFFTRGMNADPIPGDQIVGIDSNTKKRKLSKPDIALKQFRYGDALDEAIAIRKPQPIIAVLEELGRRRGLEIALSNRDEESLEPILSFLIRFITRPRYAEVLIGVANKLIDIYGDRTVLGHSDIVDELLDKLRTEIRKECRVHKSIFQIVGKIDAIMNAVEMEETYS